MGDCQSDHVISGKYIHVILWRLTTHFRPASRLAKSTIDPNDSHPNSLLISSTTTVAWPHNNHSIAPQAFLGYFKHLAKDLVAKRPT
jgi:hypothetical protein